VREDTACAPLWETKDPRVVVELLVAALEDSHVQVRTYAAVGLGIIKDLRAVESLVRVLEDDDAQVRICAARALGNIKDPEAVEALVAALKNDEAGVRRVAAVELGLLSAKEVKGRRVLEALVAVLEDDQAQVRSCAAMALGNIKDPRAVEPLVARLADDDAQVREATKNALGQIKDPRVLEALVVALRDDDETVRDGAAEALGRIKGPLAVEPLVAALNDHQVCEVAARALKRLGWQPVNDVQRLVLAVAERQWEEVVGLVAVKGRYHSMTGFSTQSSAAVEALAEALRDKSATTRQGAVKAIGEIGREGRRRRRHVPQAVDALVAALRDNNATVRLSAATALAEIGAPRAVDATVAALTGLLRDKSATLGITLSAATVLAEIGDPRAVDALVSALQDSRPRVRETAAELLKRLEWAPSDDRERALLAIVDDNWDEVVSCGTAAFEPLSLLLRAREPCHLPNHVIASWGASGNPRVAGLIIASLAHPRIVNLDPETAAAARTALWCIMLHTPSQIPSQDLLEIVTSYIPETYHGLNSEGYPERTEKVDLADVRRLARQELVRRGVEVPESLSEDEHLRIRHAAFWADRV
jgi:HEAT repeat protein